MIWWLRVRRAWVLVVGLLVLTVVPLAGRDHQVMVPTAIGGGTSAILWSTFLPLAWAAVIGHSLELRGVDAEARATPRLAVLDVSLLALSTAAAICILSALASDAESFAQIAAHLLIATGLTVVVSTMLGTGPALLATTMLVLVTFSYGVSTTGAAYVRVLQPEGDTTWSLLLGVTLSATAAVLVLCGRPGSRAVDR